MLVTRVWMGFLLISLAIGLLVADLWLAPWYPLLLITGLAATLAACYELVNLLPAPAPRLLPCLLGTAALVLANWPAHLGNAHGWRLGGPWLWIAGATAGVLMVIFMMEAARFREPGGAVIRVAQAFWVVGYIGLLGCFFIQARWFPGESGSWALALMIFVAKCSDIGAYFTGRFLGRHRMAPVLSPKKTWEGAIGGLAAAVLVALGINWLSAYSGRASLMAWPSAAGFGIAVGVAAMLGDLMESLIKRDSQRKDASTVMPGFGGVLDVLDSVLFSAPVAYVWLKLSV